MLSTGIIIHNSQWKTYCHMTNYTNCTYKITRSELNRTASGKTYKYEKPSQSQDFEGFLVLNSHTLLFHFSITIVTIVVINISIFKE